MPNLNHYYYLPVNVRKGVAKEMKLYAKAAGITQVSLATRAIRAEMYRMIGEGGPRFRAQIEALKSAKDV